MIINLQKLPRLERTFFNRHSCQVAQDLIGAVLIHNNYVGIITETEAYRAIDDPACHAIQRKTPRNAVMFGEPGWSYIYLIYGVYFCFNIVTEPTDMAASVLIRGLYLLSPHVKNLDGPGKLCREIGLGRQQNMTDMMTSSTFYVRERCIELPYQTTTRIGLTRGQDLPWRYLANVSPLRGLFL